MVEEAARSWPLPPGDGRPIIDGFAGRIGAQKTQTLRKPLLDAERHGVVDGVGLRPAGNCNIRVLREGSLQLSVLDRRARKCGGRIGDNAVERVRYLPPQVRPEPHVRGGELIERIAGVAAAITVDEMNAAGADVAELDHKV